MQKKIGIYPNQNKENAPEILSRLTDYLATQGVDFCMPSDIAIAMGYPGKAADRKVMPNEISTAITLGGDGTLLTVAKELAPYSVPVCGINLGQLGFLTQINIADLETGIKNIITNNFTVEERIMLDSAILRDGKETIIPTALNDVVISKGSFARLIRLKLYIAGQLMATYPADGIIAATSTGATGYSLSAGGPIIGPNLKVVVITPICPHTLNARSIVINAKEEIAVEVQATHSDMALTVDGQKTYELLPNDIVKIYRAVNKAGFIRFKNNGFYQTLYGKLGRND